MKTKKITICTVDHEKREVTDQVDMKVPDIFNTFDVCDSCFESSEENCKECIVTTLQSDSYFIGK